MSHVVYYGCWDNKMGFDLEPLSDHIYNNIFNSSSLRDTTILACPAFKNVIKNTFIVKSLYSYTIEWTGTEIRSPLYTQQFFNENIVIRSIEGGFFSFNPPKPVFLAERDSLDMSQQPAYFHDTDITRSCFVIPGTYDIGKHLIRKLELGIKFKQPCTIKINEGDALYYVKFHTTEDIVFKKFIIPTEIRELSLTFLDMRPFTQNYKKLEWWYNLVSRHNLKKYFIKRIKQNLL